MSELTNAISTLFIDDELSKAKRLLLGAINIVAEFFPSDWGGDKREEVMLNNMAYYNNFEELMTAKGMTAMEYFVWACNEIGY